MIPYRIGDGMREVGLEQSGCIHMKVKCVCCFLSLYRLAQVVVHELLHIVGVKHEQCRPDRDDFITIDWSNIQDGGPSQYYKVILFSLESVIQN